MSGVFESGAAQYATLKRVDAKALHRSNVSEINDLNSMHELFLDDILWDWIILDKVRDATYIRTRRTNDRT